MGRAGMNVDKMEWIFFAKGNAITEVLTNMLISISTSKTKTSPIPDTIHGPIYSTKNNDDTINTNMSITDGQSTEVVDTLFAKTINISKPSQNKDDQQPLADGLSSTKSNKGNTLPADHFHGVTYNLDSDWMREQITCDMSHDKIHQLLIKAVKEGKYKQRIVPIDIWDFGGQKDYYMTHQLFITSRGIFVLMFNGSIDLHKLMPDLNFLPGHFGKPTVAVYLVHWVNSILTYCKRTDNGFPRIIVVATHKDEKWFKITREARRKHLEHELQQLFQSHAGSKHLEFKPLIFVDATNPEDQEIANLKIKLMERATENPRWGELMPTLWIPLELQLAQKSAEGANIISRIELSALNTKNESLILTERQIETFLKVQHSLGKLVYFDVENLRDLIIISPAYLVEVLRSIVTEKQFWPQGERFSLILRNLQESGMIERNDIYFLWRQKKFKHILQYKEFILRMLVHLDIMIAPRSSFEDASCSLQGVSRFLVPCMITKGNDTLFLEKFWRSNNSIILAYTFSEEVIPPAMSYRFLSSLIASWDIKQYKERNTEKRMLFSDLAVVQIDSLHDLAVQVKTNRLIVSLIHAKAKEEIIPTLASSLQECLTSAIVRITEFYSTLASDVKSADVNSVIPFKIEFGVFCNSDICFFSHNEMPLSTDDPVWICKKHKQRHATKGLTAWFSEKEPNEVCTSSCKGLGRLVGEKCPLPQHIRRIAALLSPDECCEIAILLGFQLHEWKDLEYQFLHQSSNDIKFMALWSCTIKNGDFSFDNLRDVLENKGISSHLLCQVFRDVTIDALDLAEDTLKKIPSVNALHDLSNHIGNSTMQLAIELEVDLSYIQQIQHDYKNKLLEQTRRVLLKWRQNTKRSKPTVLGLLKALYRVGKFGPTYQIIKNHL
ncbi:uncharacterized protein LOC127732858 [Mytilus californianus]|uniref:uncharacterized protein LOC127732858 n=1 Tax=Mytilus californianus TaxID=6549 RepID=UPI0022473C3B|nr:uncharacterized protein LOC127732858 [Mytilus californianus]